MQFLDTGYDYFEVYLMPGWDIDVTQRRTIFTDVYFPKVY
jgi:hypothetical protein